jgi:hypothetical protein
MRRECESVRLALGSLRVSLETGSDRRKDEMKNHNRVSRFSLLFFVMGGLALSSAAIAKTPDGRTPAQESVCSELSGAAFGLCNAYCEALDCDSVAPKASDRACDRVLANFNRVSDDPLPCLCPCWDANGTLLYGDLEGENLSSEDYCGDFAGWELDDGGLPEELEIEFNGGDCEMKSTEDSDEGLFCSYETGFIGEGDAELDVSQVESDSCRQILRDLVSD